MQTFKLAVACGMLALSATAVQAEDEPLPIRPDELSISFESHEGHITLERFANDTMLVKGPINPMVPVAGVTPVGELEVIEALQDPDVLVVDTRTATSQFGGTIPGSVNIPYDVIAGRLDELGCQAEQDAWNCENAVHVVLYCNGPNCGQSPRAMRAMTEAGFPATRISYYRGGMLAWTALGLTTRESMRTK